MNILSPCFAALNNRQRASRAKKKSLLRSIKEAKQFNPKQLSGPMHKKRDIYLIMREITSKGPLSRLFWHSPILGNFWCDIFNWFSKQFGTNIQPDCDLAILGCSDRKKVLLSPIKKQVLKVGMVAAKKVNIYNLEVCFKRWLNKIFSQNGTDSLNQI